MLIKAKSEINDKIKTDEVYWVRSSLPSWTSIPNLFKIYINNILLFKFFLTEWGIIN